MRDNTLQDRVRLFGTYAGDSNDFVPAGLTGSNTNA